MSEEKKQYEISYLARTEADKDAVLKVLGGAGAENLEEGRLSEIKLAYPVKKQTSAYFGSTVFEAATEAIAKINDSLKFTEGILRFLIVTPPAKKSHPRFGGKERTPEEAPMAEEAKTEEAPAEKEESAEPEIKEAKTEIDDAALDEKLEEILTNTK